MGDTDAGAWLALGEDLGALRARVDQLETRLARVEQSLDLPDGSQLQSAPPLLSERLVEAAALALIALLLSAAGLPGWASTLLAL